jgi:hypothetical protein
MPEIHRYKCNIFDFKLPNGWGGTAYVKDNEGDKIPCRHPLEQYTINRVLGFKRFFKSVRDKRIGFEYDCVCLDCLHQFGMDVDKEERKCEVCSSTNIKTVHELKLAPCPKCHQGIVKTKYIGIS